MARSPAKLRGMVWLAATMVASGAGSPDHLERIARKALSMSPEKTGNFRAYSEDGDGIPYRLGRGCRLRSAVWPKRLEPLWPGALSWLTTPFWYLVEHEPDIAELMECVRLLPADLQDLLVQPVTAAEGADLEFTRLTRLDVLEMSLTISPYALGALACARRRSHISGDADIERFSACAVVWMLEHLHARAVNPLGGVLEHVLNWQLLCAADHIYSGGLQAPLSDAEVHDLARARSSHLIWSVEDTLSSTSQLS